MENDDKSFDPTPERRKKARRDGDIAISQELTSLAVYTGGAISILLASLVFVPFIRELSAFLWYPFEASEGLANGATHGPALVWGWWRTIAFFALPGVLLSSVAFFSQGAGTPAWKKVKPDLKRINPFEGFKRRFGPQGFGSFLRSSATLIVVLLLGGAYLFVGDLTIDSWGASGIGPAFGVIKREAMLILGVGVVSALACALVEVPLQRARYQARLRMSRQEIEDENKELEGDLSSKRARRERARKINTAQMLQATREADVVIVNPTHFAVALKWSREKGSAPICVAKGKEELALSIIRVARSAAVPVRQDRGTARSLFALVELGEEIRAEHYAAVAAAIRFADRLKGAVLR